METKFKGTTEQWVLDGELLMTKYSEMVIADFYPITEYNSISDIDFAQTRANMLLASKSLDLLNEIIDFVETTEEERVVNLDYFIPRFKQLIKDATEFNPIN